MRSNKGITLTSLIIYVIVFMIVIATVSTLSGYFTTNLDEVTISTNTAQQYTRLTTYITEDINSINRESLIIENDNCINITFKDGISHKYLYNNEKIYYIAGKDETINKKITICDKVEAYSFTKDEESYFKWWSITYGIINIWIFRKGFSSWICRITSEPILFM